MLLNQTTIQTESKIPKLAPRTSIATKEPIKILVVDDDEIARCYSKNILERMDCKVDIASSGKEALAMLKQHIYDLVFMDIDLPDMTGLEITAQFRKTQSPFLRTPIVGLTSNTGDKIRAECCEAGMDTMISKPASMQQLKALLNFFVVQ